MAHKGTAHISTSILEDEAKSALSGNQTFDAAVAATGAHNWVYVKKAFSANTQLINTANDYYGTGVAVEGGDLVKFIAIKHTGTSDGSTLTSDGLMISTDGTAAYNSPDDIFLEKGEMVVLKCPYLTVADLEAIAVVVTNNKPSAAASGNVQVIIAAILDNING